MKYYCVTDKTIRPSTGFSFFPQECTLFVFKDPSTTCRMLAQMRQYAKFQPKVYEIEVSDNFDNKFISLVQCSKTQLATFMPKTSNGGGGGLIKRHYHDGTLVLEERVDEMDMYDIIQDPYDQRSNPHSLEPFVCIIDRSKVNISKYSQLTDDQLETACDIEQRTVLKK